MSSPHKRRRENPHSQESKVTSTPKKSKNNDLLYSPDISEISSTQSANASSRRRLAENFHDFDGDKENEDPLDDNNVSISRSSVAPSVNVSGISDTGESERDDVPSHEYDEYFRKIDRISYTGGIWKLYKPKFENGLYYQITTEPHNAEDIARFIMNYSHTRKERVVSKILQFFLDVAGFQSAKISEVYNFADGGNAQEVILRLRDDLFEPELRNSNKFLLLETRAKLAITLQYGIYNLLLKLVQFAHTTGFLYEEVFSVHVFQFVKCMAFSKIRGVYVTGLTICLKLLTACIKIHTNIINSSDYTEEPDDEISMNLARQKGTLEKYIDFLYLIFNRTCCVYDRRSFALRVRCAQETLFWMRNMPVRMISHYLCLHKISKLCVDTSKEVRISALTTLAKLVETPDFEEHLGPQMPLIISSISQRLVDVDYKVVVKAVDVYSAMLPKYASYFDRDKIKDTITLIYSKHYPLAKASANFFFEYLKETEHRKSALVCLIGVSTLPQFAHMKPLLVEACIEQVADLQNWNYIVDQLLKDELPEEMAVCLVELAAESVHQTLTGESSMLRMFSRKVAAGEALDHRKIARAFIPKMRQLLQKFVHDPQSLANLMKIVVQINYGHLNQNYVNHYTDMCSYIDNMFMDTGDNKMLLKAIADVFLCFTNSNLDFVARAKTWVKSISRNVANKFLESLQQLSTQNVNLGEVEESSLQLHIMFSRFDLTSFVKWFDIFQHVTTESEEVVKNILLICQWYLVWCVRALIEENSNAQAVGKMVDLNRYKKEFVDFTFEIVGTYKNEDIAYVAFECCANLHLLFEKELEGPRKLQKSLKGVVVNLNKDQQDVLMTFVERCIITDDKLPLKDRQTYVVKIVEMIYNEILPPHYLSRIFRYYHSHNKEFGQIIDHSIAELGKQPTNILTLTVAYTLRLYYNDILNQFSIVDLASDASKGLGYLAKRFVNVKILKKPPEKVQKLLQASINCAVESELHLQFLHFVRYFIEYLDETGKRNIINHLKDRLPKGAEKNDVILMFRKLLSDTKAVRPPKQAPPKKRNKLPVSRSETEASDDMTIHDSESDDLEELVTAINIE